MRHYRRSRLVLFLPVLVLVGAMFTGCGEEGKSEPDLISISDFEGSWVVQQYKATSVANPIISVELVSGGGAFEMDIDEDGEFQGRMFIPASLAGVNMEMPIAGTTKLISQDSLVITFTPEIPNFLTKTRAAFTLSSNNNTVTLTDGNAHFDFGLGSGPEQVIFEGVMVKNDGSYPPIVFTEDFEGPWVAQMYKVTSTGNPPISIELIGLGGAFSYDVDDAGGLEGRGFVPASLAGMTLEIPISANLNLISQDSVGISFTPEIPPFLTDTRAEFALSANTLALTDSNTTFDFDGDEEPDPAIFEGVMVRNDGSYPPVVFTEDLEGFWETVSYTVTSAANPLISFETISMGATFDWDVDDQGQAIGNAFIPGAITGGDDVTLSDFPAGFELIYQDTLMIAFYPEVPPFLTNTRGHFTLVGDDFILTDENTYFDFGSGAEPAIAEIVMERTAP